MSDIRRLADDLNKWAEIIELCRRGDTGAQHFLASNTGALRSFLASLYTVMSHMELPAIKTSFQRVTYVLSMLSGYVHVLKDKDLIFQLMRCVVLFSKDHSNRSAVTWVSNVFARCMASWTEHEKLVMSLFGISIQDLYAEHTANKLQTSNQPTISAVTTNAMKDSCEPLAPPQTLQPFQLSAFHQSLLAVVDYIRKHSLCSRRALFKASAQLRLICRDWPPMLGYFERLITKLLARYSADLVADVASIVHQDCLSFWQLKYCDFTSHLLPTTFISDPILLSLLACPTPSAESLSRICDILLGKSLHGQLEESIRYIYTFYNWWASFAFTDPQASPCTRFISLSLAAQTGSLDYCDKVVKQVIQQNSGGQYSHPLLQLAIAGIEIKTQLANVNNHFDIELIIERHSSLVPIRLLLDLIEHTITTLPVSVRGAVIPHIQALIATRYNDVDRESAVERCTWLDG